MTSGLLQCKEFNPDTGEKKAREASSPQVYQIEDTCILFLTPEKGYKGIIKTKNRIKLFLGK